MGQYSHKGEEWPPLNSHRDHFILNKPCISAGSHVGSSIYAPYITSCFNDPRGKKSR